MGSHASVGIVIVVCWQCLYFDTGMYIEEMYSTVCADEFIHTLVLVSSPSRFFLFFSFQVLKFLNKPTGNDCG